MLLVDDNIDATQALSLLLDACRIHRHPGARRRRGAGARQPSPPDIVLLDLGLPVVDGYQVAATLRARVAGDGPLLIAISGYGQPEDRERSKAVGFDHHLVKPIDCDELLALMRSDSRTWQPSTSAPSTPHQARSTRHPAPH